MKITDEIANRLKSYVYLYIDPRNGEVFYVGKGKGNRLFSHLDDKSDTEICEKISEIRSEGLEPQIDLLRYGITDSQAILVKSAIIDLIGKSNLTNRVSGNHTRSFGRITSHELINMLAAEPVKVRHKVILITINQLYRSDMTPLELYEATRGIWKIGTNRNKAEYAMAVYQGVVREVYRIHQWFPAGTLEYKTRDSSEFTSPKNSKRWEFSGEVADEIRDMYVGYSVGLGGQNPIRYVNVK